MSTTVRPITEADYDAVARITADAYLGPGYFDSIDYPYMRKICAWGSGRPWRP